MRAGLPVGDADMAVVSFHRLHYGKLATGRTLSVPATEGYGVTRRARGLDPARDHLLSPSRLMGLRRFEPDAIDAQARADGCLVARAGPGESAVMVRARFRPEDGEGGHGRLHQQSAVWVAAFDVWRRYPAACLAIAAADLRALPDRVDDDEASRLREEPLRWRVARPKPANVRHALQRAPWADAMLETLVRGAEAGADAVMDFGGDDFGCERDFLAAVGLALQLVPEAYPRWRDISVVSGLRHAPTGLCLRYLPTPRAGTRAAA